MEVVGSISSLIFLFSLCFATAIEALQTLFHSDHLHTLHHPDWVMIVTGVNVILWIISFSTIGGFSYHQKLAVRQQSGTRGSLSSKIRTIETEGNLSCSYFCQRIRVSDLLRDFCGSFFTLLTSSLVFFNVSQHVHVNSIHYQQLRHFRLLQKITWSIWTPSFV